MISWQKRPVFWLVAALLHLYAAPCSAQNDDCTRDKAFIVTSQEDADTLGKCDRFNGDVGISPAAPGNITIDGLTEIRGKLFTADAGGKSAALSGVTCETLRTVDGGLSITNINTLQSISLPELFTVSGPLEISNLPALTDLQLQKINSVANFKLISAPNLLKMSVGAELVDIDPTVGLKHLTSQSDPSIQIRDVGIDQLSGVVDFWNASLFELAELPNLQSMLLILHHADEVRIQGNGNLTIHMMEEGWSDAPQPVMEKLYITGVKHISPCLWPDVHEFVAVNNTAKYLHFGFHAVQRLEIRDNPNMKTLIPWNGQNLYEWNLTDVLITGNPELTLQQFPHRRPDDNLTAYDCPFMYGENTDQWQWYPFHMNNVVIDANIDNTFLSVVLFFLFLFVFSLNLSPSLPPPLPHRGGLTGTGLELTRQQQEFCRFVARHPANG